MWRVGPKTSPAISMYSAKAARAAKMMPAELPGKTALVISFARLVRVCVRSARVSILGKRFLIRKSDEVRATSD